MRTLFSSYNPVETYLTQTAGVLPPAALSLKAIDAYLFQQLMSFFPVPPTVLDLAVSPTLGASTVMCAASEGCIEQVIPIRVGWQPEPEPRLKTVLTAAINHLPTPTNLEFWDMPIEERRDDLKAHLNPLSMPILLMGQGEDSPLTSAQLDSLLDLSPIIFFFPVGLTGSSPHLKTLWSGDSKLTVFRELNPFLGQSQMAVLYPPDNTVMPDAIQRCLHFFTTNYDYLTLLQRTMHLEFRAQQSQIVYVPAQGRITLNQFFKRLYHRLIPLPIRLKFRDVRVRLIGH